MKRIEQLKELIKDIEKLENELFDIVVRAESDYSLIDFKSHDREVLYSRLPEIKSNANLVLRNLEEQ